MLNRRKLFGAAAGIAPVIIAGVAIPIPGGRRVSAVKGDPGERLFAMACGRGEKVRVYLDGVEQKLAETADESEGFVTRFVDCGDGSFAFNMATDEIYRETVYGLVEIKIG